MEKYNMLRKSEFKKKYKYSESTYQRRIADLKRSQFSDGIIEMSSQEVWLVEEIYQQFMFWYSKNRR